MAGVGPQIKAARVWEKIARLSLYLLVFLLPLWFLPWTVNVLDFNKQTLLIILVFLSLFSWLLKSLIEGKISLNLNIFNLALLVFLLMLGLSTLFSDWPYGSFWGWPLPVAPSFLTIFGFLLFYFLIVNIFEKKEISGLLLIFVSSSFLVAALGIFQIFGKFILPFDFSKISSFNTIGTVNSLGIFLAALLPLVVSLILISRGLMRFWFVLVGLVSLFLLFLVNFWSAWLVLLAGSALILVFGIARREIFQANWLVLPMALLVLSLFFGVMKTAIPGLPATGLEISPSYQANWQITGQTLKEGAGSLFFGSGPGTFVYQYSQFRSPDINQTAFWGVRFSAGGSELLDKLMTTGILGLLSFLGLLGVFGWLGFRELIKKVEAESGGWILNLGILAGWLSLVVAIFLYPLNFSLELLFWFFIASFIALIEARSKSWQLEPSSLPAIGASFIFILILILGIGLFFLASQRYLAEVRYLQGLRAFQRGDSQAAINYLANATQKTAGRQDNYWRDLSQLYLFQIQEELQRPGLSQEELGQRITPLLANLVNSAKAATDASSQNVANWAARGFVYRQVIGLIGDTDQWALKSYEEAVKLEPANPYLYTEIGRVYLVQGELDKAREQFQKAIDLKSDYAPAHFQMALIYVGEGKISQAIEKMEETKLITPLDVGLYFQLGLLYYNDKKFDRAKGEFERAVALDQNYSNARYFLGLVYDREGKKDLAVQQFERIAQLNPDNEEVTRILANLRGGKPALEGIVPAQPPIEEKPPERLEK